MEARAQESLEISEGHDRGQLNKCSSGLLAINASSAVIAMCATVVAIVALIQCVNLRKDHNVLLLQVERLTQAVRRVENNLSYPTKADKDLSGGTGSNYCQGSEVQKSEHINWTSLPVELKQMNRTMKVLTEVITVPTDRRRAASVPHPTLSAELSTSQTVSCASRGEPLISCLWGRITNGERQVIIVDDVVVQSGGRTNIDGISYILQDGLSKGNCSLRIESFAKDDIGNWSCTLVSQHGKLYTGEVLATAKEIEPSIYFATDEGSVQTYSMTTSTVNTVVNSSDWLLAITYDSIQDKIYWSSEHMIYRANRSGSKRKSVLTTYKCKSSFPFLALPPCSPRSLSSVHCNRFSELTDGTLYALAFDWISGNVYAATWNGLILACNAKTGTFTCATVLIDRGPLRGLALNPISGFMYWTREDKSNGAVGRAGMDGSNPVTLVTGLKRPRGIVVDCEGSHLYWNCRGDETIQTSDLEGSDHRTVIQLASGSWPYGIGLFNGRLYWTNFSSKNLQSCTKYGSDLQTVTTGTEHAYHLVVIPALNDSLLGKRINHCEKQRCSEVCVLTLTSFRCVT